MGDAQLPDDLKAVIHRRVAEGRVASEAAYLEEAVRRYAEDLDAEDEILAVAMNGITDIEAGRYVTVATPEDNQALHERTVARVRAGLANNDQA
jgi:Arc/MetJ-type ribon-helix-helix transcriptional regulator